MYKVNSYLNFRAKNLFNVVFATLNYRIFSRQKIMQKYQFPEKDLIFGKTIRPSK